MVRKTEMRKNFVICDGKNCGAKEEVTADLRTAVAWSEVQVLTLGDGCGMTVQDLCWKCATPIRKAMGIKWTKPMRPSKHAPC